MKTPDPTNVVLAIESAISGGSISLFAGDSQIDEIVGPAGVSRAEDLLPNIDKLIKRNGIELGSLSQLVVSAGPGSFTGIRIGIATAMGLCRALNIPLRQIGILDAIAETTEASGTFMIVLPVGRDTVCCRTYLRSASGLTAIDDPTPTAVNDLARVFESGCDAYYVVDLSEISIPKAIAAVTHRLGDNLAYHLAKAATTTNIADAPAPLFIAKPK